MKMHVLIVDNEKYKDKNIKNIIEWIDFHFKGSLCNVIDKADFDPQIFFSFRPELLIVDVALQAEEENYFEELKNMKIEFDSNRDISGICYCRNVKANFADLPVILTSNFFHPNILSAAFDAGADGFIYKKLAQEENVIAAIKTTLSRAKTDDIAFYEKIRELLENENIEVWKRKYLLNAMEAFFVRGSGTRRLTGLWCSLTEIIEKIMPYEIVDKLLRTLMDTESILLAANPRMRDHVRHAGNVFWTGYYLLNKINCFRDPTQLPGYNDQYFKDSSKKPFEQLNFSWILASLLHDIGYLRGKLFCAGDKLKRAHSLFYKHSEVNISPSNIEPPKNLDILSNFLNKMCSETKFLYNSIHETLSKWGTQKEGRVIEDHGISSAAAFIKQLDGTDFGNNSSEILHATAAIALHNLSKWNRYWPSINGPVKLPIGVLPIAWLLAYCDELQGWGREPENDSFNVDNVNNIREARREYRGGYIKGSRLIEFNVKSRENLSLKTEINIGIQYMMVPGENSQAISEDIRHSIEHWHREIAPMLRWTLDLDNLLETNIIHWVPSDIGNPINVKLDSREPSVLIKL